MEDTDPQRSLYSRRFSGKLAGVFGSCAPVMLLFEGSFHSTGTRRFRALVNGL